MTVEKRILNTATIATTPSARSLVGIPEIAFFFVGLPIMPAPAYPVPSTGLHITGVRAGAINAASVDITLTLQELVSNTPITSLLLPASSTSTLYQKLSTVVTANSLLGIIPTPYVHDGWGYSFVVEVS